MRVGPVLIIGIILIGVILVLGLRLKYSEGFQTFKVLNTDYTKEVFLVAVPGSFREPNYGNGYTYDQAVEKCKSYGASLATLDQVKTAQILGAQWCVAGGWVQGDTANLYYPSQAGQVPCGSGPCADGSSGTTCVRKLAAQGGKGFANCYGVRPTYGEFGVQPFAPLTPSVFDTSGIQFVMVGDGKRLGGSVDLFTQQISPSQALYAFEKGDNGRPTPNPRVAREFIINNWTTVSGSNLNEQIRATDTTAPADNEVVTNWINATGKSCEVLKGIMQQIVDQHKRLKELYAYIKRLTTATQGAKQESMDLQREVAYVCRGMAANPVNPPLPISPACKRLAELDFEVLYKDITNGTNLFKSLQNLNGMLSMRECEMQTGLSTLQRIMDTLKCSGANAFDTATLGNFKSETGDYLRCDNRTDYGSQSYKDYMNRFPNRTSAESIGYIPVEELKKSLEEISPYFNEPGYAKIFETILSQLSVLLSIPQLNDYDTAKQNLYVNIQKRMDSLSVAINRLWPN